MLRRRPLQRQTPLQRTRLRTRPSRRQRDANSAQRTARPIVAARALGHCEMCGHPFDNDTFHLSHRRHDGMGGAGPTNQTAANLLASCVAPYGRGCNEWLETARGRRAGRMHGWILSRQDDPAVTPLIYRGRFARLLDDGGVVYL